MDKILGNQYIVIMYIVIILAVLIYLMYYTVKEYNAKKALIEATPSVPSTEPPVSTSS